MPMTQVKKLYNKGGKTKAKKYADGGAVTAQIPEGLGPKRNATLSRAIDRVALANQEPGGASRAYISGPSLSIEEKAPKSSIKPKKDPGKMKGGGKVKDSKTGEMRPAFLVDQNGMKMGGVTVPKTKGYFKGGKTKGYTKGGKIK